MATTLAIVAAMTTTTSRVSVTAFMAVDTTPFSSSITRPQVKVASTSKLFATDTNADDAPEAKKKLSIETIDDDNRHILLRPADSPERPVLVDAFAPWCGPCKLLDKVLRQAQPKYLEKVDFCRWNVNDKEGTVELKEMFLESGYTLTKLPSLIVFREGKPVAVRPGFANEFQLDDFLEKTLPDVLERTFDEDGLKMIPLPAGMMANNDQKKEAAPESEKVKEISALDGEKKLPLHEEMMVQKEEKEVVQESKTAPETEIVEVKMSAAAKVQQAMKKKREDKELKAKMKEAKENEAKKEELIDDCIDEVECFERLERTIWQNRTVVPAMDGILLPTRSYGSP